MISPDKIMPLLLEACPSFQPLWESDLHEDDRKLVYVCLAAFATHLMALKQSRATSEFPAVVKVIERLHVEGDRWTQEAATIGLLESVQNIWSAHDVSRDDFKDMLLPESRRWWQQLELFWSGAIPYVGATVGGQKGKT